MNFLKKYLDSSAPNSTSTVAGHQESTPTQPVRREKHRRVTFFDFKGLMAPVFTCFNNDETHSLNLEHIDKYAAYLKKNHIKGVLVNSVTGEGPSMTLSERIVHAEKWFQACLKHKLMCVVQVGGSTLSDVLRMAEHAESLGVHAVMCLPELFYKPSSIEELVRYCRTVARHCISRPFLYYHIPRYTGVDFDMTAFCREAEKMIPYFYGIQYSSPDLESGYLCLRQGRVIMFGFDTLLACSLILGFDSAIMMVFNILPAMGNQIMEAINDNNLTLAREKQLELNSLMAEKMQYESESGGMVGVFKKWFDEDNGSDIVAGPLRNLNTDMS